MVVMNDGNLVHDPHPSNAGLSDVQCIWLVTRRALLAAATGLPAQAVEVDDHMALADALDPESDYQRGYRHGYNRRDAEVQGALL